MKAIRRLLAIRLSSDAFDHYWTERFLYGCAIFMIVVGIKALGRFSMTGGEYVLGLLAVVNLSVLLVVMGHLMGLDSRRKPE